MNIADYFRAGRLATNVAVIIAFLPELLMPAPQLREVICLKALRNWATRIDGGSFMSR